MSALRGIRNLVVALWFGLVATLGGVVAPLLFSTLERTQAGALAGQLFRIEAYAALGLGVVLLVIERRFAAQRPLVHAVSRLSSEILWVLGALFCTVLGFFALQPLMAAARAGQGSWSFGQLHALSSILFLLKGLCLLALVWRLR
jgi:Domain of unknown function (DUF4149)